MENIMIQEIEELFKYYCGNSILDIVYNIVTMLMLIVSTISLIVSCKVYRQSESMHKENMGLSKKMHADSLTPFLVIKGACNCICLSADRFPYMEIEQLDIRKQVCLNNQVEVNINEIKGKIHIRMIIYNISEIPAEMELKCSYLGIDKNICEYLTGKEEKTINFEDEILSLEENVLNKIINNDTYMNYNLSYNGPGMSATDIVFGKIRLYYSSAGNIVNSNIEQTERKREYIKESYE